MHISLLAVTPAGVPRAMLSARRERRTPFAGVANRDEGVMVDPYSGIFRSVLRITV